MGIISYINRPEYFFQPNQAIKRLKLSTEVFPTSETFNLPWGIRINAVPGEVVGRSISAMGIYDLCISEALWRIIDEGETCVDVALPDLWLKPYWPIHFLFPAFAESLAVPRY
jgi:hypothetical protein